jgi:hypothetical protein
MVRDAQPYWKIENRNRKHATILAKLEAQVKSSTTMLGPIPLLSADPPWRFPTYRAIPPPRILSEVELTSLIDACSLISPRIPLRGSTRSSL